MNRSSATANVTLYCTWRPSGLTIGLHGQSMQIEYYKLYIICLDVRLFGLSAPCRVVVDSTAGPVLEARPRKAVPWRLAGVVGICHPVNNPPRLINGSVIRASAVTIREPKSRFARYWIVIIIHAGSIPSFHANHRTDRTSSVSLQKNLTIKTYIVVIAPFNKHEV